MCQQQAVVAKDTPSLTQVADCLATLTDSMLPHLEDEEVNILPQFRKAFAQKEVSVIMEPMIAEFDWHECNCTDCMAGEKDPCAPQTRRRV